MDKIAERLTEWFGSVPFIIAHILWFSLWFPLGGKTDQLTVIVSLEAIFLALFILRAENSQSKRIEEISKEDLAATKRIEKKID